MSPAPVVSCVAAGVFDASTASSPDDWAVRLRAADKQYLVAHEKNALIRGVLPHVLRPRRVTPFWALRDIRCDMARGECVLILGPNGAGKSTLLALVAGVTAPSAGRVEIRGRVASLLSLGTGFHPELTGEENLWLNGALLGMSDDQLRRQFDQIAAFAGLDGFLDAPLATYSSGMQMRLGFAIAIHADADILAIDEVMAVGDQAFQAKCLQRLHALKAAGKTLLIASQGVGALGPLVDRALLLHRGRLIADGSVAHVQDRYAVLTQWLASPEEPLAPAARAAIDAQAARHDPAVIRHRWGQRLGSGEAVIEQVTILDARGQPMARCDGGQPVTLAFQCTVKQVLPDPHIGVAIFRDDCTYCHGPNTRMDGLQLGALPPGTYDCRLDCETLPLTPGRYRWSVALWDRNEQAPYAYHYATYPLELTGAPAEGVVQLTHTWQRLAAPPATPAAALTVTGPRGRQAWYRAFEPLTFTVVPPPPPGEGAVLAAECRGPQGERWWASMWSPPAAAGGAPPVYQLHFPQLALLSGRYHWAFGWRQGAVPLRAADALTCPLDILADRLDHGMLFIPHTWRLRRAG